MRKHKIKIDANETSKAEELQESAWKLRDKIRRARDIVEAIRLVQDCSANEYDIPSPRDAIWKAFEYVIDLLDDTSEDLLGIERHFR